THNNNEEGRQHGPMVPRSSRARKKNHLGCVRGAGISFPRLKRWHSHPVSFVETTILTTASWVQPCVFAFYSLCSVHEPRCHHLKPLTCTVLPYIMKDDACNSAGFATRGLKRSMTRTTRRAYRSEERRVGKEGRARW